MCPTDQRLQQLHRILQPLVLLAVEPVSRRVQRRFDVPVCDRRFDVTKVDALQEVALNLFQLQQGARELVTRLRILFVCQLCSLSKYCRISSAASSPPSSRGL